MPGRRLAAALLVACAIAGGACNEDLCTRDSECPTGLVCSADALCVPAPNASTDDDDDDAGAAVAAPRPERREALNEPPIK
jgi:hypothetical protein